MAYDVSNAVVRQCTTFFIRIIRGNAGSVVFQNLISSSWFVFSLSGSHISHRVERERVEGLLEKGKSPGDGMRGKGQPNLITQVL